MNHFTPLVTSSCFGLILLHLFCRQLAICVRVLHALNSQLARIVVLEQPLLRLHRRVAVGHDQLLLALVDRETLVRGAVAQQARAGRVVPVLVALGTVARVQDHVLAGVIQAGLVPPDLTRFAQHPILLRGEITVC